MKSYAKLAIFMAVLLFSVSMLSVAIEFLGPIERIDINFNQGQLESTQGTSGTQQQGRPGGSQSVSLGQNSPLFELLGTPETEYLRWTVKELYVNGTWQNNELRTYERYYGGSVYDTDITKNNLKMVSFTVKPLFNITEDIPTTYPVEWMLIGPAYYSRDLKTFYTSDTINQPYEITHSIYDFTDEELSSASVYDTSEYLNIPIELESKLIELANDITVGYYTTYDKLKAIERYLKENYEYNPNYQRVNGTDPIEFFLFNSSEGVCTHFNSALTILARAIRIPARTVNGFHIKPYDPYQLVLAKQAHMWTEVPFNDYGWISFDATPVRTEEKPSAEPKISTVTNIYYNDPVALKGKTFNVYGTVLTTNGSYVSDMTVEVFLNKVKNEKGVRCGVGEVQNGLFNITCEASPDLEVRDYNLVAHALPSSRYDESWSDPPIKIMAETEVVLTGPTKVYVNETFEFTGQLFEIASGEPVSNTTVVLTLDEEDQRIMTDEEGKIVIVYRFDSEGNRTIQMNMNGTEFYLNSNNSFGVSVLLPPQADTGLLQLLTSFPTNLIVFTSGLVVIGAVYLYTQKKAPLIPIVEEEDDYDYEEDLLPLTYNDYKEGVVKVFNRFYRKNRRRYKIITESMTPREFQYTIMNKIPQKGESALEYLITAFEIADYSLGRPTKDMFDKCQKAVEVLDGLMEDEQKQE